MNLTRTERLILELFLQDVKIKDIAAVLRKERATIERTFHTIKRKTGMDKNQLALHFKEGVFNAERWSL